MAQQRTSEGHKPTTRPIVTRFLARRLWSASPQATLADSVAFQRRAYERAFVIVRVYYAVSILWVVQAANAWPRYADRAVAHPLWPVFWWFHHISVRSGVNIIFCAYFTVTIIVALVPERRLARVAYAFILLQYMALVNGFDKGRANLYPWFFAGVVFILLPRGPWRGRRRIADRQFFLTVIWCAQLVVLFFYSLSGLWKIYFGIKGMAAGRISGFSVSGFSYIVSNSLLRTNVDTVLGHFFSRHEIYGWIAFCGTMYLEAGSGIIAFRPRLHHVWGLGLITFHVGTLLAMGFTFPESIVLLGLFLVCSPFTPDHVRFKDAVFDLPVLHFLTQRLKALRHRAARAPTASG